jgi:hypothetical protein
MTEQIDFHVFLVCGVVILTQLFRVRLTSLMIIVVEARQTRADIYAIRNNIYGTSLDK